MTLKKYNLFLSNINYYFKLVKYNFITYIIINVLVSILDGIGIALFIPFLTSNNNKNPLNNSSFVNTFHKILKSLGIEDSTIWLSCVILFVFIIKGGLRGIQVYYSAKIRHNVIKSIRINMLENISKLSYNNFTKHETGKLVNLFTSEMPKLYANMTNLFFCIQYSIMAITYLILATLINWQFAIIIIIISALIRTSLVNINKQTHALSKTITNQANILNQNFIQLLNNFKYLKSTNEIFKFSKKTKEEITKLEYQNYRLGKLQSILESIKEPLAVAVIIILLIFQQKNQTANLESLIISLILVYKAVLNFNLMNASIQSYYQTAGSLDSIKKLNNDLKINKEKNKGTKKLNHINNIQIKDLTINYHNTVVLEKININIKKNQVIALVGESGSGKTSILNYLLGLFSAKVGTISINDIDVNEYKSGEINSKIGYIPQEISIFNDTIFNNVSLFEEKTTKNIIRFKEAIKLAAIEEYISSTPNKEDTKLGENGLLISGGQRQRIAIAREFYKNPEILIMDEATSALDYEREKSIRESLEKLKGKCTIIIVAHRISTLKSVDNIYILNNKRIIEEGSYEELKQKSEIFNKMLGE